MNRNYLIQRSFWLLLAICCCSLLSPAQQVDPALYGGMRWRMIGPFRGGRVLAVSGVEGQRDTYYFGAVAGGVWKSTNAGETWRPIFDGQGIASIGALAVAPSDPNILYVGTGEAAIRSDITFGNGVYKSNDAGKTWKHLGLEDTRHIGRILVDPKDPNVVLVAALGHAYGPNAERGVYRSTDGGATWSKVLFKDEQTGAIDMARDPDDPSVVYATLWNAHRPPWSTYAPLQGPGGGLYRSNDGGATWKQVTGNGLPGGDWGRSGVAIGSGSGKKRIYVLIDLTAGGGLYRSDDDGAHWRLVGTDSRIHGRGWYFGRVTVDPEDPDIVYVPNVALYRSGDGGENFEAIKGAPGGDDYHFLWIDAKDPQRMIVGVDQGAVVSVDGGKSWSSWYNQPTAQFYHVATDDQFPYFVYGAQQDSGTVATTSRSDYGSITYRDWFSVGGGESGYIVPAPKEANIVFAGDTYGRLFRFDKRTGQAQDISPSPVSSFGTEISKRELRFTWTSPVVFSPQDPNTLYMGSQYLLRTTDAGLHWERISPDLTGAGRNLPEAGPLSSGNARARGFGVIYTVAPSPLAAGVIWAGSDTGLVHITRDGGKTWSNVSPPGLPEWSKISILEASHFDAGTAYLAADRHRMDDLRPYIFRTQDFGKTWQRLNDGISAPAFVRVVREDAKRKGLLFAGTELGVYVSFDDGSHWQPLQLNLPVSPVRDISIHDDDLVAGTHGRSFWILDNITPLRQISSEIARSSAFEIARSRAFLFQPQTAIRIRRNVANDTPLPPEFPAGENPPSGAIIDYYMAAPAQGEVTLEILDASGSSVRRYSSADQPDKPKSPPAFPGFWLGTAPRISNQAGMHRFTWDLRYRAPAAVSPSYGIAATAGQYLPASPEGTLALPGKYQVKLTVDGKSYVQPLILEMDPRVRTSVPDLQAIFDAEQQISALLNESYRVYESVEAALAKAKQKMTSVPASSPEARALKASEARLSALLGAGDYPTSGSLKGINQDLARLMDAVDSADRKPTEQSLQALQKQKQLLVQRQNEWKQLQAHPAEP